MNEETKPAETQKLISAAAREDDAVQMAKRCVESENAIYNKYDAMHTRAMKAESENERLARELEKIRGVARSMLHLVAAMVQQAGGKIVLDKLSESVAPLDPEILTSLGPDGSMVVSLRPDGQTTSAALSPAQPQISTQQTDGGGTPPLQNQGGQYE